MQNPSMTSAAGLQSFSGREEPSTNRLFNQPSSENTSFMEPNHHSTFRVDPNRGAHLGTFSSHRAYLDSGSDCTNALRD